MEKGIERLIEGKMIESLDGSVHPMEIARKVSALMKDEKKQIEGFHYAPNCYRISLSKEDYASFGGLSQAFSRELNSFISMEAEEQDFTFLGPLHIEMEESSELQHGGVLIKSFFTAPPSAEEHVNRERDAIRALLIATEGFGKGGLFPLREKNVTVGRDDQNDIAIGDPKISLRHCTIEWLEGDAHIVDQESTNGIVINGKPVKEKALRDRDIITLGFTTLVYRTLSQ
ncbi:MAG: FhaA domain-containing protein [Candidatus Xenobiia bacterium LiM19]